MILLALGSNLGDRLGNLKLAISLLENFLSEIIISPIYESKALLPKNAPDSWDMHFLNMVIGCVTKLSPVELLDEIKKIEKKIGRDENYERWSPRIIDIDILAYNNRIVIEENLQIPHKELLNRDFFMIPANDIAPDWKYPIQGKNKGKKLSSLAKNNNRSSGLTRTKYKI